MTHSFLATQVDDEKLTVDGNNPLCGREAVFALEILTVRDATDRPCAFSDDASDGAERKEVRRLRNRLGTVPEGSRIQDAEAAVGVMP